MDAEHFHSKASPDSTLGEACFAFLFNWSISKSIPRIWAIHRAGWDKASTEQPKKMSALDAAAKVLSESAEQIPQILDDGSRLPATGVMVFHWSGISRQWEKVESLGRVYRAMKPASP